ncbi:DNA replication/repair protein RecF [Terricaulis silvestris]|uniref:DNA replication and repair protein RecF n=1 Tax=Terricaulis silvestris TaxID=2686094 RepID=A0A6I6MKN6_9CAUL|nr:DNA replication/repair protein RecF [Terricaulis silvestris]QGZ93197.1 DNA replication and repair protein RecF [Terricaulis silvestris]
MTLHSLYVSRLMLTDFRNHAALDLALDARPVCLFGANGAGKTNILEALTMLAPSRGLRAATLVDVARTGGEDRAQPWAVSARVVQDGEESVLGAGAERTPEGGVKRVARRDGMPATATELAQAARMTWLTPAMDRLWSGAAGDRRRFFDRLTLARASEHGSAAAQYERAMRERQRLLADRVFDDAWLGGLEREMSAHGAAIAAARVETLQRLQEAIDARPDGAFPKAILSLDGLLEARFERGAKSADVEEDFAALLREVRGRDAGAGRALDGPHRSDLLARHAAKDMPADQCSTGEQKALLVGLTLAQARALSNDPGAGASLILIDEAAAHLDSVRRAALFDELLANPGQAWLTGTDENLFEAFGTRAQRFEVKDGVVSAA